MTKQIPNMITALNLLSGAVAVLFAVSGDLIAAAVFMVLGIFFDFFDGLAARKLNATSEIGLQLDSLADMITCGLAPGLVMVQLLSGATMGQAFHVYWDPATAPEVTGWMHYLPLVGLLVSLGAAYRLAKFNVDTRQTSSFIGLPTPANTLLIISLPLILEFQYSHWAEALLLNPWFLIGVCVLSVVLMNAELPLFSLKFKTWDWTNNKKRYLFLILSIALLVFLKFAGIPALLALYILMSLIWKD